MALMNISGLGSSSNRERGRLRWFFRTEWISGQTGTITADLGETLQDTLDQLLLR